MALWDSVLAGFDAEDETLNFGTRAVAESKSAIYETKTIATIQASDKEHLQVKPQVTSMYHPKAGLVVCTDRSFTLFNCEGSIVCLNSSLNAVIEAIDISSDGALIFIGLSSGELICLNLLKNGVLLFSVNLNMHRAASESNFYSRILSRLLENRLEIIAVTVFGNIYKIYGLEMDGLNEVLSENEDNRELEKIQNAIKIDIIRTTNSLPNDMELYPGKLDFVLAGSCIKLLSKSMTYCCNLIEFKEEFLVKKIHSILSKFIICLTIDGRLLFMCPYTMQLMFSWLEDKVMDFTVLESDFQGSKCSRLLFLTLAEPSELVLLSLNGFSVEFRLTVSKDSFLVNNQSDSEDILYLEGYGESKIDSLHVKSLIESQREDRLDRFLRKGYFEKAEKFAERFSLSLEIVYKAKVKWLMGELQPWKNSRENRTITELIDILKLIKDEEFVAECCINTIPPDLDSARLLLDYIISRVKRIQVKNEKIDNCVNEIGNLSMRLGTFLLIGEDYKTPEKWLSFSVANLVNVCNMYLSKGKIREAVIICERHRSQIKMELTEEQGLQLLEVMPTSVDITSIINWLRCFIPLFLSAQENVMTKCFDWIYDRTKQLEYLESDAWPEIGLRFCTEILEILKSIMEVSAFAHRICPLYQGSQQISSPIHQLQTIINSLNQLCSLKKNHSLLVPFEMFSADPNNMQENIMEIIWLLFENVPLDGINHLIQNFVNPYCLQHVISVDYVISSYLMKVCGTKSIEWEGRLIVFVECIKNINEKMVAVLRFLKDASVPWSNEVESLADWAIKLKHRLSSEIFAERNRVEKKLVLKKYGLPLNGEYESDRLITYIFKQGHEEMFEDVKKLVKGENTLDHYVYYILHCLETGNEEKIFPILDSEVPVEKVIERVLFYMRTPNRFRRKKDYDSEVLPVILNRLTKLSSGMKIQCGYLKTINMLKNEFDVVVKFSDISCSKVKLDALSVCIKKILSGTLANDKCDKNIEVTDIVRAACKTARCLEFPPEEGIIELALQCLNPNNMTTLISLSARFLRLLLLSENLDKCNSDRIYMLAYEMLLYCSKNSVQFDRQIVHDIHELSNHLLLSCESWELSKFLDLNQVSSLLIDTPVKPNWTKFYVDPMGSSFARLPNHIFSIVFESILCDPDKNSGQFTEQNLEVTQFPSVLSFIKELPQELASLRTIFILHWLFATRYKLELKELKIVTDSIMLIVSNLIQKMLSSRVFDLQLTLCLLHFFKPDQAIQWLKNISLGLNSTGLTDRSIRHLSLVGKQYCLLHNEQLAHHFDDLQKMCKWALQVQKYGLSAREPFKETDDERRHLLLKLMEIPEIELSLLWDYCKDMHIDYQECMLLYLEQTLLNWNPVFKLVPKCDTGEPGIILETSYQQLLMQCRKIVTQIRNTEELVKTLKKLLACINVYNYECFLLIIELLETYLGPTLYMPKLLLTFLFKYVRICGPKEQEVENWFIRYPNSESIPPISQYRLPFTPLPPGQQKWELIRSELNLKTYKLWLQAPVWFNVSLDKNCICTITIHNLKNEDASRNCWDFHCRNKQLMEEIMECVRLINSLEMLTPALYFVVNHVLPPGVDQVDAVQKCYMYALQWHAAENSRKSYEGLMKAKKKYFSVSTLYILHKHGLVRPEYLNLVQVPSELIAALYNDPSIVNSSSDSFTLRPDINKAVESIAALHEMNIATIRSELLSEWLQPDNSLNSFNETIVPGDSGEESVESEKIVRACYMLARDVAKSGSYLVGLAFPRDENDMNKPVSVRLRALQCLVAITTSEELEVITARDIITIRNYMQSLEFVCALERIGFCCTVTGFEQFSKTELVKMLLSRKDSSAVHLASTICQAFSIKTPTIWNSILDIMTTLCMFRELEVILPEISDLDHILDHNVLVQTWNQFMLSFINKMSSCEKAEEIHQKVEKCLDLLRVCPVVKELNLPTLHSCFQKISCAKLLQEANLITNGLM